MENNNTEMSTLDKHIPKYYKGYDMDILLTKLLNREPLTKEEKNIIGEAQDIYYRKHFENNRKKWDEYRKAHPDEKFTKHIDPQRTDKGRFTVIDGKLVIRKN